MKITSNHCTGCGACSVACPQKCISMKENRLAEKKPIIDSSRCVSCKRCQQICPQNHPVPLNRPSQCYAAWSNNSQDWVYSSSGGAVMALSRVTLKHKGVVFGCDYTNTGNLEHFSGISEKDLQKFQSSKYSRSDAFPVFKRIKELVAGNTSVLFVGTPCQVAGLKGYLGLDYPSLITVDLVCHGTPPNKYLLDHLRSIGITPPYQSIRFRGKYDQKLTIVKDDVLVYQKDNNEDRFFKSFYNNSISYRSCYTCPYAGPLRVSDITVGDFWGLGQLKDTSKKKSERPSLILVNTASGARFFEEASENLIFENRSVSEGISGNGRLNNPPGEKIQAFTFRLFYPIIGFRLSCRMSEIIENLSHNLKRCKRKAIALIKQIIAHAYK